MLAQLSTRNRTLQALIVCAALLGGSIAVAQRTPIVLDTDIGSDIDDAFAVAMILQSKQLDLKAVTTVSGDTQARARIVAKMLTEGGKPSIPVAAGAPDQKPAFAQARWAEGFTGPDLVAESAVDLLKQAIDSENNRMVVVAIGPLTNVAALLRQHPEERGRIREIVLMGGSIAHGYTPGSGATAEYNIAADPAAARSVFSSGVPIRMAPLDVTAGLQLDETQRQKIFGQHTAITDALQSLYRLWGEPTPTLHDPMALSLITEPALCKTKRMHVEIGTKGETTPAEGPSNAVVAVETEPGRFISYYTSLFTPVRQVSERKRNAALEEH